MTLEHDHSMIHLLKQIVVAPQESDQLHPLPISFPPQCIRHLDVQFSFFKSDHLASLHGFDPLAGMQLRNDCGQVIHTYVSLSPSSL